MNEPVAFGDGTSPIRLIDLRDATETTLARIRIEPRQEAGTGALQVDPHPAWDRSNTRIAFNACPEGRRPVFVANLREVLNGCNTTRSAGSSTIVGASRNGDSLSGA